MDYFEILNLNKEPFSNSPDPDFFFQSRQHLDCLQKLEIAIRLKRGLNVVIGDVGTGKTTLCRQLIRKFAEQSDMETHLILDPLFSRPLDFLRAVAGMLSGASPPQALDETGVKEHIKNCLFAKGVDQGKTIVLILDEGQKLPVFCLEMLREFLNYETNQYKLLQIVIFGQQEFSRLAAEHANFTDRINLYHVLGPLNFSDTRRMIRFRLERSSPDGGNGRLFTYAALWAVYRATGGFPRKIVNLCHRSILTMIIQNRSRIGPRMIRSCVKMALAKDMEKNRRSAATWALAGTAVAALLIGGFYWLNPGTFKLPGSRTMEAAVNVPTATKPVAPHHKVARKSIPKPEPPASTDMPIPPATGAGETAAIPAEAPSTRHPVPSPSVSTKTATLAVTEAPIQPPQVLGRVALKPGEFLWRLIKDIYGSSQPSYLHTVLAANPDIVDADRINVGAEIIFPAIPAGGEASGTHSWWVRLKETDTLTAAVGALRSYPKNAPPTRILAYWTAHSGLKFAVILKENLYDRASANFMLHQLPQAYGAGSEVVEKWGDGEAVFYSKL